MDSDDRPVVALAMVAHAAFHAYELAIPVFVVVWLDSFAVSTAALGVVVGAGYAFVGLGAVPSGLLADRFGSKRLVVASVAGMGAGFGLLGVAPSVAVLGVALVCWGAAAGLYHPAGLSLLSRSADGRGTAFAYHGVAGNVGTVVGPVAAATLLATFEWRTVALAFALPGVALALVAARIRVESDTSARAEVSDLDSEPDSEFDSEPDDGDPRHDITSLSEFFTASRGLFTGVFPVVFAVVMCYGLYYRGALTFLPDLLAGLALFDPVSLSGTTVEPSRYVFAGLLFAGGVGQYVGGRLTDVVPAERALVAAFVALGLLALGFVPASSLGVAALVAVCVALGFTVFLVAPVYQVVIAERVQSDAHGLSFGYTYLGVFGVGALGATGAGAALSLAGPPVLFALLAGLAALAAALTAVALVDFR